MRVATIVMSTNIRKPIPTGSILLTHIKQLATHNAELGEISDAAVFIRGNLIEWVGHSTDLPEHLQEADVVHDLSDHVALPGLVNTHHHSEALLQLDGIRSSLYMSPTCHHCWWRMCRSPLSSLITPNPFHILHNIVGSGMCPSSSPLKVYYPIHIC